MLHYIEMRVSVLKVELVDLILFRLRFQGRISFQAPAKTAARSTTITFREFGDCPGEISHTGQVVHRATFSAVLR